MKTIKELKNKILLFQIYLFSSFNFLSIADENFSNKIIERAKNSVVTIEVKSSLSANLDQIPQWSGTGSVLCKTKGIILTNAHVSGRAIIGKHDIVFQNGSRADAKLIYYDPWLDFAFLKVDPKEIPKEVKEISFSKKNPFSNQPIMIIGNNEGKSFSVHTGNVSNLYDLTGQMPQHCIKLSLNAKGGSSGSPVFDVKGNVIALNFAASQTFALAIHPEYIRYTMKSILKDKIPKRRHIGILTGLYSLSDAIKYRNLPKEKLKKYMKLFPKSNANAIIIKTILKNSPSYNKLKNGDIIWSANGKIIGPNLIDLDMMMNKSDKTKIHLEIIRDGKILEFDIGLYDLEKNKITTMISFNKQVIFKMDDLWSNRTGAPSGTITATGNMLKGFYFKILAINLIPMNSLDDVIKIIPALVKEKYFFADIYSYSPYFINNFSGSFTISPMELKQDLYYDSLDDPKQYVFNSKTYEWDKEIIK
ncbi:MAG: serine protease [Bacteroidetes bacterium]|nr:serine protease [Bacteroidota bacterium]